MSSAADVVFRVFIGSEIVEVVKMIAGRSATAFESLEGLLANLWMGIAEGDRRESGDSRGAIRTEVSQLGESRGGKSANLGRWHSKKTDKLRHAGGIIAAAKLKGALCQSAVLDGVHATIHIF